MANKKPLLYSVYEDLVKAAKGIGEETFLDRPNTDDRDLTSFIVVNIPTTMHGRLKGKMDVMSSCYGMYSVYCKAKTNATLNIGKHSDLVQSIVDLFPINGQHISATEPTILMRGEDGYGYQVTQITFKIRTKFNI